MPVAEIPELAQGFSRWIINLDGGEYRITVNSVCDYCGWRMIGTIAEVLQENEVAHRLSCATKQATSAAAPIPTFAATAIAQPERQGRVAG
jgi:hypothetical protein